jgi:hypothetical protein
MALLCVGCRSIDRAKAERFFAAARTTSETAAADVDLFCNQNARRGGDKDLELEKSKRASAAANDGFADAYRELAATNPPQAFRERVEQIRKDVAMVHMSAAKVVVGCIDDSDPALRRELSDARDRVDKSIAMAEKQL